MKRTNFTMKVLSALLCLFLVAYFGFNLMQSLQNPLRTAPAITMQIQESFSASGIIIRDETVITVNYQVVGSLVREGERVSVGMVYLVGYQSEADRERDMRRRQIEQEIAHLEASLAIDSGPQQIAAMETELRQQIRDLGYATRRGNLERLEERTISIQTLALAGDRESITSRLETLRAERMTLLGSRPGTGSTPIAADRAGLYSAQVDGYEFLSPRDLSTFDVQALRELLERRSIGTADGAGKLVTGNTWYYVALIPETEVAGLEDRLAGRMPNQISVNFSGLAGREISMWVHSIGESEGDYRVVVFSANTALAETLGLRRAESRIVWSTITGLRVPREALHRGEPDADSGAIPAYVFVLTLGVAERKFVEILHEGSDYFLVRPDTAQGGTAAPFREGNTIIVRAGDLYDGRVFRGNMG